MIAIVAAPNLTSGKAEWEPLIADTDFVRVLRHGFARMGRRYSSCRRIITPITTIRIWQRSSPISVRYSQSTIRSSKGENRCAYGARADWIGHVPAQYGRDDQEISGANRRKLRRVSPKNMGNISVISLPAVTAMVPTWQGMSRETRHLTGRI